MFKSIEDVNNYLAKLIEEDRFYLLEEPADEIFDGELGKTMEVERIALWDFCMAEGFDPLDCDAVEALR